MADGEVSGGVKARKCADRDLSWTAEIAKGGVKAQGNEQTEI